MIFDNLVLTFLSGMECPVLALMLDRMKGWTRQAACKQPGLGWQESYKVEPTHGDRFTASILFTGCSSCKHKGKSDRINNPILKLGRG